MSKISGVTIRSNSTIKLKMPSGMTIDWTYLKGAKIEQMLQEVAESVGLKVATGTEQDIDIYRDLCGELLSSLKDMVDMDCPLIGSPSKEDLLDFWEHEKSQGRGIAGEMLTALNAITKAEAIMGDKS